MSRHHNTRCEWLRRPVCTGMTKGYFNVRCAMFVSVVLFLSVGCTTDPLPLAVLDQCPDVDVSRSEVVVRSVETTMHDIAFSVGCNGHYWIAALDHGRRTELEKQSGSVSAVELAPEYAPQILTFAGVVGEVPYDEFTYSWRLTEQQQAVLDERGQFIRLTRMLPGDH